MTEYRKENLARVVAGTVAGALVGLALFGLYGAGVGAAVGLMLGAFAAD